MTTRYPDDEKELSWLGWLMDAYAVSDRAVKEQQDRDKREHGFRVACSKGCMTCCYQQFIPLTNLELAGIVWFICHKMAPDSQREMMAVLDGYSGDRTCPLLRGTTCAVYPVRPLACRQFILSEKACEPREDVLGTRPEQVLKLENHSILDAYRAMLPFYGYHDPDEQEAALEGRFWLKESSYMHQVDWPSLFVR